MAVRYVHASTTLSLPLTRCVQIYTNQQPSVRILETHPDRHVISCKEDKALCTPIAAFRQIYTQELILMSALRQQIDWDEEAFQLM